MHRHVTTLRTWTRGALADHAGPGPVGTDSSADAGGGLPRKLVRDCPGAGVKTAAATPTTR
ncbi:hypothetical protein SCATT_p15580 (plasmid) [Streptantibioticus cattleyicolor NRRL 8057 = DSM 46488]|uniref:Uncharacterized protein n=1 Tax=Streptantibioticus cattleyicolor (strain ATCC 35852 / DSM 46488 / JCM 4925 / NBRC 14057 / NRRL 8057) TaxID=1003195 RepID=G8XH32_STREN|nr:hypothetical protein SCATT_p15580 [Streptantibioticus cattleyicolor NRRL 8057 = DSM 46488]